MTSSQDAAEPSLSNQDGIVRVESELQPSTNNPSQSTPRSPPRLGIRRNETLVGRFSIPRSLNQFFAGKSLPRLPSIMHQLDDTPDKIVETSLPDCEPTEVSVEASIPQGKTPRASVANLTNNMIGAGVLSMSFVFSVAGVGLGSILMLIVGWLSSYTLRLMVLNGKLARRYSYRHVAARALGQNLSKVVDVMIASYGFGLLVAYWNILGDFFPVIFRSLFNLVGVTLPSEGFFGSNSFITFATALVLVFPLCCLRNMDSLGFTSAIALLGIIVTVVGIGVQFVITVTRNGFVDQISQAVWFNFSFDVFRVIPVISLAFSAHLGVLRLYQELQQRTVKRMFRVIISAVSINFIFYALCGSLGYFAFLTGTTSNLINAYEEGSFLLMMSMVCMSMVISFSYPLIQYPVRKAILLFFSDKKGPILHYPVTVFLFLAPFGCSLLFDDLSIILGFLGSTFGVMLSYILPPILFFKLRNSDFGAVDHQKDHGISFGILGALCCIIGGVFIGVVGVYRNIVALVD
ncbi:hypothetical protein P9112_005462 [Eukaryota sp. TZLM1-RC]